MTKRSWAAAVLTTVLLTTGVATAQQHHPHTYPMRAGDYQRFMARLIELFKKQEPKFDTDTQVAFHRWLLNYRECEGRVIADGVVTRLEAQSCLAGLPRPKPGSGQQGPTPSP